MLPRGGRIGATGRKELYGWVMEIARGGDNGEYFENLRPARHSPVAGDPGARMDLAGLTGRMLSRFEI